MRPLIDKQRAIVLRRKGYSYNEICKKLNLAKSTCSVWLRNVRLDKEAIHRLVERQDKGRLQAALTLRQYREERDRYIKQKVDKCLENFEFTQQAGKLLCAALYWAEGEKKTSVMAFSNSNPAMIKVFTTLLRRFFNVEESKFSAILHLHNYHNVHRQKEFWSKVTDIRQERIAIYKKPNSGKNVREGYPGCISIRYFDVRLAKEIEFLYNALITKIRGRGPMV